MRDDCEWGDGLNYGPWAREELDLLAAETADLLPGDGFEDLDEA
jgi:hypothetical protein